MAKKTDTYEQFPGLNTAQLRQLCYIAYYGEDYGSAIGDYVKSSRGVSRNSYTDTMYALIEKGYLLGSHTIEPKWHLDILDYLAIEHHDWLLAFRNARRYSPTNINEYLWKLAELLRKDDFTGAANLSKPYEGLSHKHFNIYPYIRYRVTQDPRYAKLLDDDQLALMTSDSLEYMFQNGTLDNQALDSMRKMIPEKHPMRHDLLDRISMYEFFQTGNYTDNGDCQTTWTIAVLATKELYKGNTEDSLALFRKAVKTQGRKAGAFPIPMLNYFFALCILKYRVKYGQLTMQDVLDEMRSSSSVRLNNDHFAPRLLLEYAEVSSEGAASDVDKRVNMVLGYANNNVNRSFAALLMNFFKVDGKTEKSIQDLLPSSAIMTHELSPYIAMSTLSREDLATRFGGKPLISTIRKKPSWEVMLGEIGTKIENVVDERPRQIIYFMSGKRLSAIVQQVMLDDGTWKDEMLLSQKVLCNEGYESMDLADSRIAMQLQHKEQWQTDADIIVPNLADKQRLYFGKEYSVRIPARIIKETPSVEFNGHGDSITISSNVLTDPNGIPRKNTVLVCNDAFILITLNPLQKDILMRLLQRQSLPSSAAPTLQKTIESLKGIMEVRENILSDITMKAYESDGKVAVRIEPVEREYVLTLLACPLTDGTARIFPAQGEEYVYDEDETGHTHCVQRNMIREEENYQALVDFAEQYNAEFHGYNICRIGDERALLSLLAFCHKNPERFLVEWPNGQKLKFKGILTHNDVDIDVKSGTDWFEVEGQARLTNKTITLEELVAVCCKSNYDGFVKIGEDEYIQLTETLRKHIAELDAILTTGEKKGKRVPKYLIGALAHTIEDLNNNTDNGYRELMDKMKAAYTKEIAVPDTLQATLRPYQEDGYRWMRRLDEWGAGACLADDMGLGKTLQAITFMLSKADIGPSIVVAPKSVLPNWVAEIAKFAPMMQIGVLNEAQDRNEMINAAGAYSIILCTYGVLTTQVGLIASKDWNVACLDEAQQIKNRQTQVSRAAMDINAKSRIILTGTPLQNHVGELWNLMQFINPGLLGKWSVFRDTYVNTDFNAEYNAERREMLKEMTQPFILRRTKQQVLSDLPEKIEGTHYVMMTDNEAAVYEKTREQVAMKFKKHKTKEEKAMTADLDISYFQELTKLRLLSCDAHLVYDLWKEQASKVTAFMEIMETLMDVPDNNILVFSQFTSFLAQIKPLIEKRGWDYLYLDGQTPLNKRQTMVEQFQDGEKRLFLSSLKAGGLGINLTKANYVILLDPWWNPAIESQATDRAHRIGQKRCISVIRLITQNTIEEKILRLHETKRAISDDVLDGTSESYKLTYEDILDMVAPF